MGFPNYVWLHLLQFLLFHVYFRSVWQIKNRLKKQVDPAIFSEQKVYFSWKIIQINFKYWCLSYFRLLFLFALINCSQMKVWKWKISVKLCLKFCRLVESSASGRRNSAKIMKGTATNEVKESLEKPFTIFQIFCVPRNE